MKLVEEEEHVFESLLEKVGLQFKIFDVLASFLLTFGYLVSFGKSFMQESLLVEISLFKTKNEQVFFAICGSLFIYSENFQSKEQKITYDSENIIRM